MASSLTVTPASFAYSSSNCRCASAWGPAQRETVRVIPAAAWPPGELQAKSNAVRVSPRVRRRRNFDSTVELMIGAADNIRLSATGKRRRNFLSTRISKGFLFLFGGGGYTGHKVAAIPATSCHAVMTLSIKMLPGETKRPAVNA